MKKTIAAIMLLVYFTVSTGFAMSTHYCMDEIDSVQLGTEDDDSCNRCGMETGDNNCCRDEVTVHKLETSHIAGKVHLPDLQVPVVMIHHPGLLINPFRNFKPEANVTSHGPPLPAQEIYIDLCVFRI